MTRHNKIIEFVTTVKGWIILITSGIVSLSGTSKAILALVIVYLFDFITGCWASWKEHRENPQPIKAYFIESAKIRKSIVKATGYMMFIFLAWVLTILYFDREVRLPYSKKDLTIVQVVIGVCIATEGWSIIENFKRMGFDLVGKVTGAYKAICNIIKTFKKTKDEISS